MNGITAQELGNYAEELNFNKATLEKVYRLIDVLNFINTDHTLKDMLVLKGGTALNLLYFNLPRLSVDIDLDFVKPSLNKEEILRYKNIIKERLNRHMLTKGFNLNSRMTRTSFSLDSYTYNYTNTSKNIDNIKIEINYSMRIHLQKKEYKKIIPIPGITAVRVNSVSMYDLFASKFTALLFRNAIRDLYDINNILKNDLFKSCDHSFLKKGILFYASISQADCPLSLNTNNINNFNLNDVKISLLPVVKKGEFIDLEEIKNKVIAAVNNILILNNDEKKYLHNFSNKIFTPELLFDNQEIIQRLKKHPMVVWKMADRTALI